MDLKTIRAQAEKEIAEEKFKAAVAAEKARLLTKKSVWERLFPFKITITRR